MIRATRKRLFLGTVLSWAVVGCSLSIGQDSLLTRSEYFEVDSLRDDSVDSVIQRMQSERALFVFDIDNTLLQYPQGRFVGSDQWYRWQRQLEESSSAKIDCVLDFQGVAYYISHLLPTDNGYSTSLVQNLQQSGHDVIALTARTPEFRAATERELQRNNFDFRTSVPRGHNGFPGVYFPRESGAIRIPRPASYQNGIAMLAGQHKGDALLDLLARLDATEEYDYVIFFDDATDNTSAMIETFDMTSTTAIVFHFTGVNIDLAQYDLEEAERIQDNMLSAFADFERSPECDI